MFFSEQQAALGLTSGKPSDLMEINNTYPWLFDNGLVLGVKSIEHSLASIIGVRDLVEVSDQRRY